MTRAVYAFGNNTHRQTCHSIREGIILPRDITDDLNNHLEIVWTGLVDTAALDISRTKLFRFGSLEGSDTIITHPTSKKILKCFGSDFLDGFLDEKGIAWCIDPLSPLPGQWRDVVCSQTGETVAISTDGRLYSYTSMERWRLAEGLPFDMPSITFLSIAAGANHFLALDDHGQVYSWGDNRYRQTSFTTASTLIQMPTVSPIQDIVQIVCGAFHSAVRTSRGQVQIWGWDKEGQCGGLDPKELSLINDEKIASMELGWYHSMLATPNALYVAGSNKYGQLGTDRIILNETEFTQIDLPTDLTPRRMHLGPFNSFIMLE